ncbi:DNA translocase FtsK [Acidithiobacillus sp. IBUN Pt1247-S3]|uniref:DNA translocase FtsK n=1 Tax=Acidithiobacillus sp. IBUN Pt1247-S3 TaxID=3166642 RepID=UPI0034E48E8C
MSKARGAAALNGSARVGKPNKSNYPWRRELLLFVLFLFSLFVAISLISFHPLDPSWFNSGRGEPTRNWGGETGAELAAFLVQILGIAAWLLPFALVAFCWSWLQRLHRQRPLPRLRILGGILFFPSFSVLLALLWPLAWWPIKGQSPGGIVGFGLSALLAPVIGSVGAGLLFFAAALVSVALLTRSSPAQWLSYIQAPKIPHFSRPKFPHFSLRLPRRQRNSATTSVAPTATNTANLPTAPKTTELERPVSTPKQASLLRPKAAKMGTEQLPLPAPVGPPRADGLPELALLDAADADDPALVPSAEELVARSRFLEEKFADFGVSAQVVDAHPGPVITRYEIEPAAGVKVSQVAGLSKDLARVLTARVRVVEAIPGKATMGIEVPNPKRRVVRLSEILGSSAFSHSKSLLTLALGQDISGQPIVADLARMPHLLVAGTTGAGKSVGVNAMILSILYKATAQEVRMILVDPKMLELSVYEGIPHLLAPVVTDMQEAANALRWCVAEMERRYKWMAHAGVRNLAGYNQKLREADARGETLPGPDKDFNDEPIALRPLPAIVVVIDEFADLMMVVGKQVETLITRLAQKARAAGLHLIMATQRPSVDVITGLIKANIPTRIAFQVSSRIDSRTILDQMGAETLLGQGDMLYLPPGSGYPLRVHGAYVSDDEVHRVVESLRQLGAPEYDEDILSSSAEDGGIGDGGDSGAESDPLYDQAVAIVTSSRKASISYVQRQLKVGYNRAARMIEEMERVGIVGPLQSNGSREVYAAAPPRD